MPVQATQEPSAAMAKVTDASLGLALVASPRARRAVMAQQHLALLVHHPETTIREPLAVAILEALVAVLPLIIVCTHPVHPPVAAIVVQAAALHRVVVTSVAAAVEVVAVVASEVAREAAAADNPNHTFKLLYL